MRDVLATFGQLWPSQHRKALDSLIGDTKFYRYPEDKLGMQQEKRPKDKIVIMSDKEDTSFEDMLQILDWGFQHIVQKRRADFPQELLTSCILIARPKTFLRNPIPFVLIKDFTLEERIKDRSELKMNFRNSKDKSFVLAELDGFLRSEPRNEKITDLCIQAADELITNALFNAPVDGEGQPLFKKSFRQEEIELPESMAASLFCCYSDYRIVIGCTDKYGSLERKKVLPEIIGQLSAEKVRPKNQFSAGAGMGMRNIVDNASNFYMYCDKGHRSLVGCGFLTASHRANLSAQKHLHFSFSD